MSILYFTRALDAGELPAFRVGSRWRITRETLDGHMCGERPEPKE